MHTLIHVTQRMALSWQRTSIPSELITTHGYATRHVFVFARRIWSRLFLFLLFFFHLNLFPKASEMVWLDLSLNAFLIINCSHAISLGSHSHGLVEHGWEMEPESYANFLCKEIFCGFGTGIKWKLSNRLQNVWCWCKTGAQSSSHLIPFHWAKHVK